jgi:RNA polymerase sigma factor (sigma-70 family)
VKKPEPDDEVRKEQLWTLIVAHHSEIVGRLAFRTGNRGVAEELANELWVKIGGDAGEFLDDPHPLEALMRMAHRIADTEARRRRRRGEQCPGSDAITGMADNAVAERLLRGVRRLSPDPHSRDTRAVPNADDGSSADPMTYADLRMDLGVAVAKLTPRQQEALYLHYRHAMGAASIATNMRISRQAVEKLLDKARRSLRTSSSLAGWNEEEVGR